MSKVLKLVTLTIAVVMFTGCADVYKRQRIRSVGLDVYDGVNAMKTGSQQLGYEGWNRYNTLWNFTVENMKRNSSPTDIADTMPTLEAEKAWMQESMAGAHQVDNMGTKVLKGLGWREAGPPDSLLEPIALIGGGVAAGAAAF